jgi:hypothetical protein
MYSREGGAVINRAAGVCGEWNLHTADDNDDSNIRDQDFHNEYNHRYTMPDRHRAV